MTALTVLKPRPKDKALRSLLDKNKGKSKSSDADTAAPKPATADQQCKSSDDGGGGAAVDPSEPAAPAPTPTGGAESKPQGHEQGAMAAFWKPTLSLHLVHHFDAWPHARQLPPFIVEQVI